MDQQNGFGLRFALTSLRGVFVDVHYRDAAAVTHTNLEILIAVAEAVDVFWLQER